MKTKSCSLKKAIVTYITVVCFVLGPNIVAIGAAEPGPIEGTPQVQMPYLKDAEEANREVVDAQVELEAYMKTGAPEPVLPEGPVEAFMSIPVEEVPVPEVPLPINTTIEESYDESGNLIITTETVEEYDLNGNLTKEIIFSYDENGNRFIKTEIIYYYNENGDLTGSAVIEYDKDGNILYEATDTIIPDLPAEEPSDPGDVGDVDGDGGDGDPLEEEEGTDPDDVFDQGVEGVDYFLNRDPFISIPEPKNPDPKMPTYDPENPPIPTC